MVDRSSDTYPLRHHVSFLNIAQYHCIQAQVLDSKLPDLLRQLGKATDRDQLYERTVKNVFGTMECAMISIVFGLMAAEAFINNYAISNTFPIQQLRKLKLANKYKIIPERLNGNQVSVQAIDKLKKLIRIRKDYVHFETSFRTLTGIKLLTDLIERDY